jgi:hypothetical protein
MTSFAVAIEPEPQPRLAVLVLAVHVMAAASPWIARMTPGLAALMSLVALVGLASTLAAVPGPHHGLARLAVDGDGWRVGTREGGAWVPAALGPRSGAWAGLVFLEVRAGGRSFAWLLPRGAAPAGSFRSLKARVRLA